MKYADVKYPDVANGPGVRVSLFVSGCRLNCPGCFNKEAQSFRFGKEFTQSTIDEIIKLAEPSHVSGLSLLGGDPMEKENQSAVLNLCRQFKEKFPDKTIWLWTGRIYPKDFQENGACYVPEITESLLSLLDVIVDGPFVLAKKNLRLKYRGSENQRVIDVKTGKEIET